VRRFGGLILVVLTIGLVGCGSGRQSESHVPSHADTTPARPATVAPTIEAGRFAGPIRIDMPMDSVFALLGPPTSRDAAMGKVWASWRGSRSFDVYGVRTPDFSRQLVRQIRTADSTLVGAGAIRIGSRFADVRGTFGKAAEVATFERDDRGGPGLLLDDIGQGIAFEMWPLDSTASRVIGFVVHAPGQIVTREYLPAPGYRMLTPRP
jgi:hypothetical protein